MNKDIQLLSQNKDKMLEIIKQKMQLLYIFINYPQTCNISRSKSQKLIKSPRYTGGDLMFLYRFVRRRRRRRRRP